MVLFHLNCSMRVYLYLFLTSLNFLLVFDLDTNIFPFLLSLFGKLAQCPIQVFTKIFTFFSRDGLRRFSSEHSAPILFKFEFHCILVFCILAQIPTIFARVFTSIFQLLLLVKFLQIYHPEVFHTFILLHFAAMTRFSGRYSLSQCIIILITIHFGFGKAVLNGLPDLHLFLRDYWLLKLRFQTGTFDWLMFRRVGTGVISMLVEFLGPLFGFIIKEHKRPIHSLLFQENLTYLLVYNKQLR